MTFSLYEIEEATPPNQRSRWFWLVSPGSDPRMGLSEIGDRKADSLYQWMNVIASTPETALLGKGKYRHISSYDIEGWQFFELKVKLPGKTDARFYLYRNSSPIEGGRPYDRHIVVYFASKEPRKRKANADYEFARDAMITRLEELQ